MSINAEKFLDQKKIPIGKNINGAACAWNVKENLLFALKQVRKIVVRMNKKK